MEVKINEIRVGNIFIGYDDKLFSWGLKDFCLLDLHTEIDEIIKLPVEISEQILLKVGFVQRNGISVWMKEIQYLDENYPVTLQFTNNHTAIQICRSGIGSACAPCEYLHQLQNLYFALIGQELDVSNLI